MLPSAAQFSSDGRAGSVYSVPAKSFVLGEYAVLSGCPALVSTFGPRFTLSVCEGSSNFHPASPAGRLLARARPKDGLGFVFSDPLGGQGGFGASTAQFALVYGALAHQEGWVLSANGARRLYRQLMADEPLPPSGADLIAQWSGGVVCFDPQSETIIPYFERVHWRNLLVFSAAGQPGRKVATHEHLARVSVPAGLVLKLRAIVERVTGWAGSPKSNDMRVFGHALTEYAQTLFAAGLELEAARADREALSALPGVLGVKGTGALLADGVLVLLGESVPESRADVIAAAQARGLLLVADGLGAEAQAGFSRHIERRQELA